jgi:hypothetical protein
VNAPANIPTQQTENSLDRWRPYIERALRDADLMTFEDIRQDILHVRKLLFDNGKAFAVLDIQDYTKGRVVHVLAAGGSLKGLKELQAQLMPFFKMIGARRLTQAGRLGWKRTLPAWGWKETRVLMELEIDG